METSSTSGGPTNSIDDRERKESNPDSQADKDHEKASSVAKKNDDDILEMPSAMRRVDWRWAVAKGYLNKDTNEWNEKMGGQKAYLKQRNDRMMARSYQADVSIISMGVHLSKEF
jgi:hypothetical protein